MAIQDFDFTTKTVKDPKRKQIFIASNNDYDYALLSGVLREKRLPIVGKAEDYRGALELVRRHKVGILLIDSDLKGVDVGEMLDKLKINFPEVRVVIISGSATRELVENANSRGAIGFLTKPLQKEAIIKLAKRF